MELWCPDDIGRDGWDWVGPPAWVRACFNSPEWGGGSSPVETEPPKIVLLLLLLLLFAHRGTSSTELAENQPSLFYVTLLAGKIMQFKFCTSH